MFSYPLNIQRSRYGVRRQNIAIPFGVEKLEWRGYPKMEKFEDIFSRFDRIPACDGQTDRHLVTETSALCIPSRGKSAFCCVNIHRDNYVAAVNSGERKHSCVLSCRRLSISYCSSCRSRRLCRCNHPCRRCVKTSSFPFIQVSYI